MSKLLLVILIGVVVYLLWKKSHAEIRRPSSGGGARPPEAMLRCTRCGVYFPVGEAVMRGGHAYCSLPHAQQGGDPG